ncbi:Hypothetical protein FKW44_008777 [Caligus rogercresseyi]|uniref:Uncharacterized protein n=1 Tax=Caligus rogercresseyi TaxID=217165 RepID=A0A7T8KGK5_CALRO|nr:Hypothetical protein FKW44_008777 [Caligus rogercresseyi]
MVENKTNKPFTTLLTPSGPPSRRIFANMKKDVVARPAAASGTARMVRPLMGAI